MSDIYNIKLKYGSTESIYNIADKTNRELTSDIQGETNVLNDFVSQVSKDDITENGTAVSGVLKYNGYTLAQSGSSYGGRTAASGKTVIEFAVEPRKTYVVRGTYAGTSSSYPIAFYGDSSSSLSSSAITNATQIVWNSKSQCTKFTVPSGCTYVKYVVSTDANYDEQYLVSQTHDYELKESVMPDSLQRTTDQMLQTSSKSVVGAINELYSLHTIYTVVDGDTASVITGSGIALVSVDGDTARIVLG